MIIPILQIEHVKQEFSYVIKRINLKNYQKFFKMPKIDSKLIKNWNDFVFMNFLGIENLINKMTKIEEFDPEKYKLVINENTIDVKLQYYTNIDLSLIKNSCEDSINKIISDKVFSLYSIFLFYNKNYRFAYEYLKDYFTRPFKDNKLKMILTIFLIVKGKY